MGAIFNTQGTLAIIHILSTKFTQNFSATATDAGLINDLDPATGMSSFGFCGKYRLVATGPGAGTINSHFAKWLNHYDVNGGNAIRTAMVGALRNTAKYSAIEFFVCPDTSFSLHCTDYLNSDGMYSLVVTAKTPTYDLLP
jgi:hypothetical protein